MKKKITWLESKNSNTKDHLINSWCSKSEERFQKGWVNKSLLEKKGGGRYTQGRGFCRKMFTKAGGLFIEKYLLRTLTARIGERQCCWRNLKQKQKMWRPWRASYNVYKPCGLWLIFSIFDPSSKQMLFFLSPNELRSDKMHAISRKTSNIFMSERNWSNLNSCFCISRQVKNGVAFWWSRRSWTITLKYRILQKPIHSLIGIYGRFVCLA